MIGPLFGSSRSGTAIPKTIVGISGSLIGDPTDPLTPDATTGKMISYIKLTRTATGAGDLMGDGAGGVAISIDENDVVSVTDGTNTATITVTDFAAVDDQIILMVELTASSLTVRQESQLTTTSLVPTDNLLDTKWTTSGGATVQSATQFTMTTDNPSRVLLASAVYVDLVSGDTCRISARISDLTTLNKRIVFGITASSAPYEETQIGPYSVVDGLICAELSVTRTCKAFVYFGNGAGSPGTAQLSDTRCIIKSGRSNGLVSFGDSICKSSIENGSFEDYLACYTAIYAAAKNIPYRNRGVSGSQTSAISTAVTTYVGTPGTVFLEGGVNDLFNAGADPNTAMQSNMANMIAAVIAAGGVPVCFDVPLCGTFTTNMRTWMETYNTWLHGYCAGLTPAVQVVPLSTILTDDSGAQIAGYYSQDLTHPNYLGHQSIAEWMLENITYYGDTIDDGTVVPSTGTLTLTPIAHGDTATPVATVDREVRSTVEMTSKQVEKYVNKALTTLDGGS